MRRVLSVLLVAVAAPVLGQGMKEAPPAGAVASLQGSFNYVEGFITKAAEQVPEADYAFKPTPEVRSLGQVIAHVADAQNNFCSGVMGQPNPSPNVEKTKTTKAEIVEALKASGAVCTKAYAMSDEDSHAKMKLFGREMPKFTALVVNLSHDWEHYGNLITYMRLKGMTPPSSQPRPATK